MTGYSPGFIDLQDVHQHDEETTSVQQRIDEDIVHIHGSEGGHLLRQRIRELESLVTSQNAELQDKEVLKRNNDALLEKLSKVTAERDAIVDDREKLFKEKTFYEEQARGYLKEIETYKEKLNGNNKLIVETQKITKEKVRSLEQKVLFWQGKYENERKNTDSDQAKSSSKKVNNGRFKSEQSEGNKCSSSPQPKRIRRIFHQSPTVLPKCKNCSTVFDMLKPHEVQCSFHRLLPQPWKTWKKQVGIGGDNFDGFDHTNTDGYMYWPCCEHMGLKEPPGCLKLKSHDLIYPEVQD